MEDKILIVDDIDKNIQILGSILGRNGYAVSYATSGRKALEMTFEQKFTLILLDVMMPQMDGFEVCRELKKRKRTRDVPIIFLTAKTEQKDINFGLQLGAVDYLTKPVNDIELIARVKTHTSLQRARKLIERRNRELKEKNRELAQLLAENRKAHSEIKTLRGMIPICSKCKKIRDDKGFWNQIETYISEHSEAQFTHSICLNCARELYPDLDLGDI
ncbi:PleD family two-component system response regulator [Desulfopila sp. IMCC35008]|uniref:response regulator n=1 Tax=Desulfopila sp. IMCC35008 TaxID=2653858 RepID=UPI0013D56B75|nr:response regulator [Desulfopila sp. IMCC35008]